MLWVLGAAGILAAVPLLLALYGLTLPRVHDVACRVDVGGPPEEVWRVIDGAAEQPEWNDMVTRCERVERGDGREVWCEHHAKGPPLVLEVVEREENRTLVRSIADAKKVFSGSWRFVLEPSPERAGATRVTISEHGEVPNPLFRAMASLCMPADKYIRWYLRNLARRFGDEAPRIEAATPARAA